METMKPCNGGDCFQAHLLPSVDYVQKIINGLEREKIEELYQAFFGLFANQAGSRKMTPCMHAMFMDCEKQRRFDFWKFVVDGLELSGKTRFQALEILLERTTERTTEAIDAILYLIAMPRSSLEIVIVMLPEIQRLT